MIYKVKQFIRHSSIGNWITKIIQESIFFPPLYRLLFHLHLTEINPASPDYQRLKEKAVQSKMYFEKNEGRVQAIIEALADKQSKRVYKDLIQLRST